MSEKKEGAKEPEKEEGKGLQLPDWIRDLAFKLLPWVIMGMIGASIGLYTDNIGNKRDIAREIWRNDQQDARHNRFEANQDKLREDMAELRDDQNEFNEQLIKRLDVILEKRTRRER